MDYSQFPAPVTTLALIALSSIPAIVDFTSQRQAMSSHSQSYEDEDGESTPEAIRAYSARVSKVIMVLCSATGTLIALVSVLLANRYTPGGFIGPSLVLAAWILLTIQVTILCISRSLGTSYDLGRYVTLSCIILIITISFDSEKKNPRLLARQYWTSFHLQVGQIVATLGLGICGISVPRRPEVFHGGHRVDRLHTVSLLQRLNWSWPTDILALAARRKDLDLQDLPRPDRDRRAKETYSDWEQINAGTRSLWKTIIATHRAKFVLQWFAALLSSFLNLAPQWCVLKLLRILERQTLREASPQMEAWVWALLMAFAIISQSWVESFILWLSWAEISIPIRAQLSSALFKKSLVLKNLRNFRNSEHGPELEGSHSDACSGQQDATSNLIGVDTTRIAEFSSFSFAIPESLWRLSISLGFLVTLLGWQAPLAGLAAMCLILPINLFFSRRYLAAQKRLTRIRDQKLSVISEVLRGIHQIKFSASEPMWEAEINRIRESELRYIWKTFTNDLGLIGCWILSPLTLAAVSIGVSAVVQGQLTPSVAFVSLGVFRALETTLSIIPELTTDFLEARVSAARIENYLGGTMISSNLESADEVTFRDVTAAWTVDDKAAGQFRLRGINANFPQGELSIISGKTGSGKSMMLAAILGEVELLSGSISVPPKQPPTAGNDKWIIPGAMAFVSQQPWIDNSTIQENILFGLPLDETRLRHTINACALHRDLKTLPRGAATEVGGRGVNLSGGQRWRVALARAVYSRAEILVLDDVLSAVDSRVGRHLVDRCLRGSEDDDDEAKQLLRGRTRILATHNAELCASAAAYLVELAGDGSVRYAGPPSPQKPSQAVGETNYRREEVVDEDEEDAESELESLCVAAQGTSQVVRKFVKEETRQQGAIGWRVYAAYMRESGGGARWAFILAVFVSAQAMIFVQSYWLKTWTEREGSAKSGEMDLGPSSQQPINTQRPLGTTVKTTMQSSPLQDDVYFYLGIYALLSMASGALATARHLFIFRASLRASRALFSRLCSRVLRAPVSWLDRVPLGRLVNRFTADAQSVDSRLAYALGSCMASLAGLVGAVAAGVAVVSPLVVAASGVLLAIGARYARVYLRGAVPVKRLESVAKSPVFELYEAALQGMVTIRAFGQGRRYLEMMYARLDDWTVATWHMWLFNRWVGWRISSVGSFFAFFVAALILLGSERDAALAGFALAFALEFPSHLTWAIRHYSSVEFEMNAAERIAEYCEVPIEPTDEGHEVSAAWPTEGRIEVTDLVVTYASDLPPVLKGITFSVNSNERIGIVGRTGAGKTSLTMALFRLLEAQSGTVRIDGIDLSEMKLHDIRSRLAIIPQDPVLFSGTLRSNLDPSNRHTDAEIFHVLKLVHVIPDMFTDLSSPISQGGINLSQGQRQLICFARSLVRRAKVLVLDEATSAVDSTTDSLIQQSIRESTYEFTLLVVAHRLHTVADFDRILVLRDGEVVEYDTPMNLWNRGETQGVFRRMCEDSRDVDTLRKLCLGT